MDVVSDAYATLGIGQGSSPDEVRRAYRRAVERYGPKHASRNPQAKETAAAQLRIVNNAVLVVGEDLVQHRVRAGRDVDRPLTSSELDAIIPASSGEAPAGDALDPLIAVLLASMGALLIGRSAPVGRIPSELELAVGLCACGIAAFYVVRYAWRRR